MLVLNDEVVEVLGIEVELLLVDELSDVGVEEVLDEVAVAVPFQFPKSVNFNTVGSL